MRLGLTPGLAASGLALGLLGVAPPAAFAQPTPAAAASSAAQASRTAAPRFDLRIEAPPELREALQRGLDLERWERFSDLDRGQLRALVQRLPDKARPMLEALGYFSARIDARLVESEQPPSVVLRVDPGEPTRVTSIDLQVVGPDGRQQPELQARLLRAWKLPTGSVFVSADWQRAKSQALLRLSTERYAGARIDDSRARVDPALHQARLSVRFDTGPGYRFGATSVQGLQRYPLSVVTRQLPWRSGDPYLQHQLLQLQARLQDSGYFTSATVAAPVSQARGDVLPVAVEVVEQRARGLGAGLGYSSNTGARAQLDYNDLNVFGRAWRLDSHLKVEALQQSFDARLHLPPRADGADDSIDTQLQHSNIQGLTTRSQSLGLQRRRSDADIETVLSLQFVNEQQQISGASASSSMAWMPGYAWTRRRLDSRLDPRRGNLLSAQVAAAARALLSSQDFLRVDLHALQFVELGRRDQLLLRAEFGDVLSRSADGIPQQELFRAGGVGSVRGYAYQSLGLQQAGAVLGGRVLATASVEAVHWLRPRWGAAVFVDAGNAADTLRDLHPVLGYGVGVRWRSPAGLISVDLAHGRATGATRIDFNVGVSF